MSDGTVFVGREDELKQWATVLASPEGQAVVVVGQEGMGKTLLLNRMVDVATNHPDLKCGAVRYEVTPTDSVDGILTRMITDAYQAAHLREDSFSGTEKRREQWRAFLNLFQVGDLWMSLRSQDERGVREQFLGTLERVSEKMPENGRAIFVIDPEKYMQEDSDQAWAIVVKALPPKVKLLFAQRPEDVLASSDMFRRLGSVERIPKDDLSVLEDDAVDELIGIRLGNAGISLIGVREAVRRYDGHPYAVDAALRLIGDGVAVTSLPSDPSGIAAAQWNRICKHGPAAIRLFEAYAILEVPVPDEVAEYVSQLSRPERLAVVANPFLAGLLRGEAEGRRIYHGLLADHVREQISDSEARPYHERAAKVYRKRLHAEEKPDALAARRLPEHVMATEGKQAFAMCFANECFRRLWTLGLLDAALDFSERALRMVSEGSEEAAVLLGNLGLIYQKRGELDRAEEIYLKALEVDKRLGRLQGMARDYGNLGLLCQTQGQLDKAEEMHRKSLDIGEKLGDVQIMAIAYGNLGLIYRARGDLDTAEEMHLKSLEIHQRMGDQEGMATQYGNLGLINKTRGELDRAEDMLRKGLDIAEDLGNRELMANQYANLGGIYWARRDYGGARDYLIKARDLYERMGMAHMVEKVQGWIDDLPDAGEPKQDQ